MHAINFPAIKSGFTSSKNNFCAHLFHVWLELAKGLPADNNLDQWKIGVSV